MVFRIILSIFILFQFTSYVFANYANDNLINTLKINSEDSEFSKGIYQLEDYIYMLPDTAGKYTIEQVMSSTFKNKFRKVKPKELVEIQNNIRFFWLKLRIKSTIPRDLNWLLNLGFPEVKFYNLNDSIMQPIITGSHRKNINPILNYSYLPAIPITLKPAEENRFLIRIQAPFHFQLGHKYFLANQTALLSYEHEKDNAIKERWEFGLAIGILITVIIYHLFLFYFNKTNSYLAVSVFSLMFITQGIHFNKFNINLLEERNTAWLYDIDFLVMLFLSYASIFAVRSFFPVKTQLPRLNSILQWELYFHTFISIVLGFFYLWDKEYFYEIIYLVGNELLGLLPMVVLLTIILISFIFLYRKYADAGYFTFAIGIPLIDGILAFIGANLDVNWLPQDLTLKYEYVVSSLVLSFALARRYKILQDEKIIAEKEKVVAEQQQLMQKRESEKLKELDQTKTNLYTNITHEFRTPLTIIQGLVNEMPNKIEEKEIILRNTSSLLLMVNQMLDLSKLESGNLKAKYIQDDIIPFIHYQTEALSSYANNKFISLNFYTPLKGLMMDFDTDRLGSILTNLISNAIKFTPEYGKVQVAAELENKKLLIIIKDTGVGIPEKKIPFIFDRFYQLDSSSSRKGEGTGIGLALVKESVLLLEGQIEVESQLNKGTTFRLYLPIRNTSNREKIIAKSDYINSVDITNKGEFKILDSLKKQKNNPTNINRELAQLLIIEDNRDVITYLKSCLKYHYNIISASNGKEGLILAKEQLPDIILCDVMMPEMDGFEVCQFIKEDKLTSHIPIILLTAKATQKDKIEGLSKGADAYLTKPFNKEELLIRLQNLVEIRKKLHDRFINGTTSYNSEKVVISPKDNELLETLSNFIKSNMMEGSISIPQMQKAVNLSRTHLHKKLKALTGLSATEFKKTIRLKEAKALILGTENLNVSEVAYRVGYEHPHHFSRDFKEMFGVNPSGVIKKNKI